MTIAELTITDDVNDVEETAPETPGYNFPLAPIEPPVSETPQAAFMVYTAEAAARWLTFNRRNRNKRISTTEGYGRDVDMDNWKVNGEAVKISRPVREGEIEGVPAGMVILLDGQHRSEAVQASGESIPTLVVWGLEPDSQDSMDSGIRRNLADVFRLRGEANAVVLATATRHCLMWSAGDVRFSATNNPTKMEMQSFFRKHPELRRSAVIASRVQGEFKPIRQSVLATAHWVFTQIDPETSAWFFQRLADGAEMTKDHPIMRLRKRLMDDKANTGSDRVPSWQQMCYYIRAWNRLRDGHTEGDFLLLSGTDRKTMPMPR